MNWKELREFINTLTEEQLEKDVILLDNANDMILQVIHSEISDERFFGTYGDGVIYESAIVDYIEEELEEFNENIYLTVENNSAYLICE